MIARLLNPILRRLFRRDAPSPAFIGHPEQLAEPPTGQPRFLCGELVYAALDERLPDPALLPQPPRRAGFRAPHLRLAVHRNALALEPAPLLLHDQYLAWLLRCRADQVLVGGHAGPYRTNLEVFVVTVGGRGPLRRHRLAAVREFEVPRPDDPAFAGEVVAALNDALADHQGLSVAWAAPLPSPPPVLEALFELTLLDEATFTRAPVRRHAVDPDRERTTPNRWIPALLFAAALLAYLLPPAHAYLDYRESVERYERLLATLPPEMAKAGLPALTRRAARDKHLRVLEQRPNWAEPLQRVLGAFAAAADGEAVLIRTVQYAGPTAPLVLEIAAPVNGTPPDAQARRFLVRVSDRAGVTIRKPGAQWRTRTINGRAYRSYTVEVAPS